MGKEQREVCSGDLVVVVEAAVWLKVGLSLSRVEKANVGELGETARRQGVWIGVQPVSQLSPCRMWEMVGSLGTAPLKRWVHLIGSDLRAWAKSNERSAVGASLLSLRLQSG